MSDRRWLVTGAAGFIGSNLCAYLLARDEQVVGYDNFLTGSRANIDRLAKRGGAAFTFVEGDILDRTGLAAAVAGAHFVVHLAAQVSVQRSLDDPRETNAINVTGFLETLHSAAAAGVSRFIYASSCAVYGDNPALPLSEAAATAPLSPYAASKLIGEHYAITLSPRFPHMHMTGFRFFNVFGPFQDRNGGYAAVIPRWIGLLMDGQRPIVFGDGSATRDFCFVDNVCALIHRAANIAAPHAVYNVGTGKALSLAALYGAICERMIARGSMPAFETPERKPRREGDIVHSLADISLARSELGFTPELGLAEGIDRILGVEYGVEGRAAVAR